MNPAADKPMVSTLGPSRPVTVPPRHPLGLPAGSVRAILALLILGLTWTLVVLQRTQDVKVPVYLYYLMFLTLGHFFAAHGKSIAGAGSSEPSPLHLPRGVIRTVLLLGFVGVFAWRYYKDQDLQRFLDVGVPLLDPEQPYLPFVLVGAFFAGILVSSLIRMAQRGSSVTPYWIQDILAWISLLATAGLIAEIVMLVIINPTLPADRQINLPNWQMVLAAVISFYFGVRS
jgi:hypothetical protein